MCLRCQMLLPLQCVFQPNCIHYVQAVRGKLAAVEDVDFSDRLTFGWFNMLAGLSEESSKGYVLWSGEGGKGLTGSLWDKCGLAVSLVAGTTSSTAQVQLI